MYIVHENDNFIWNSTTDAVCLPVTKIIIQVFHQYTASSLYQQHSKSTTTPHIKENQNAFNSLCIHSMQQIRL